MSIAFPQVTSGAHSVNATHEPPIHWPSAFVGLFLAVLVVVGVSWLAAPRRGERVISPAVAAQSAQAPAVPTPVPTPIPAPPVTPPAPVVEQVRVAFTNGSGVNLRARAGERAPRIKTVPEGTILEVVGGEEVADGLAWRNVREPGGTSGWVAAKFVVAVGR